MSRLTAARTIGARHEPDAQAAAESYLQSRYDTADARCFQISDDDEISMRPRPIGKEHGHAAADRQAPRRFRERIEQESRERVSPAAAIVRFRATRDATRSIELEPHVGTERNVDADARLQRSARRRARIDDVGAKLERWKHSLRCLLRPSTWREREAEQRRGGESLATNASIRGARER